MFWLDGPMNMALPNSEARAPNLPQAGPKLGVVDEGGNQNGWYPLVN